MEHLTRLPNIGSTLAEWLRQIGVNSYDDLVAIGSVETVLRIGHTDRRACYNMLYAIEGTIQGVRWHGIPWEERERLKREFDCAHLAA